MDKAKAYVAWLILFLLALVLLELAFTGRLAILLSIALVPDNVAVLTS